MIMLLKVHKATNEHFFCFEMKTSTSMANSDHNAYTKQTSTKIIHLSFFG